VSEVASPTGDGSARRRAWALLWHPRGWRAELLVAVLTALLGLGLAVTVRTQSGPSGLALARQDDLVRILADLSTRNQRLQQELTGLQDTAQRLRDDAGGDIALQEARDRAAQLGILAGTLGAQGPGVVVRIADPAGVVRADVLLDAIEELRDAGAEAIDLSGVRVVTSTSLIDRDDGVVVDGHRLAAPYELRAIGDGPTLQKALDIPGGVTDAVTAAGNGAAASISVESRIVITSLHRADAFHYAQPTP